jgi:enoyl-CoA hydratase/carnithine racemase
LEKTVSGAVVCLTLNRPDKRNAVDDGMRVALSDTLAALDSDTSVRVVILTGAGTAFCAGVDLATPGNVAPDQKAPSVPRPRLTDPLDRFSKPVIAALNGVAAGGGLELALACDMRIAANTARFSLPEVRLGSIAGSGGTQRLNAAVGSAMAAQMLFTGEMISAERAFQAGLVSELLEPEALMDRAWTIAQTVAENAPLSLQSVKRALRAAIETPLAAGLDLERSLYLTLAETEDRKEGRAAFRERRKPDFRGR